MFTEKMKQKCVHHFYHILITSYFIISLDGCAVVRFDILYVFCVILGRAMHIRYLMLDNGIEFQDDVVTPESWVALKPKMVCKQDKDPKTVLTASCD